MPLEYPFGHELGTVLEKLLDPAFIQARSLALGEERCQCTAQREQDAARMTTVRVVGLDLPRVALRFFSARQTMHMEETWRRQGEGWCGSYHVDIPEQPLTIDAEFTLEPTPEGCLFRIAHTVHVTIPLVSRPSEAFIAKTVARGTRAECDYLRDQLARAPR